MLLQFPLFSQEYRATHGEINILLRFLTPSLSVLPFSSQPNPKALQAFAICKLDLRIKCMKANVML
jgi:hypothetical protein